MSGVYFHIPVCHSKCSYCDFYFSTTFKQHSKLVEAMKAEVRIKSNFFNESDQHNVQTIYFGGGTPSAVSPSLITELVNETKNKFNVHNDCEITLEVNPEDVNILNVKMWLEAGINRISIGIQSFYDEHLKFMNRTHSAEQSLGSLKLLFDCGFTNVSADLIYGIPGLSNKQWTYNLEKLIELGVPHISCYALTIENGTKLGWLQSKNKLVINDEDAESHFHILQSKTLEAGYEQYEVSNFAQDGFRSRHNSAYWNFTPYLGIGPSAHSYNGISRFANVANLYEYMRRINLGNKTEEIEHITIHQQFNEYVMTRLRTREGINYSDLMAKFEHKILNHFNTQINRQEIKKFIIESNDNISLNNDGIFMSDFVMREIFIV